MAPILSYVEREAVDGSFQKAIGLDDHIVVYGSSKQGKTALRQKHIPDSRIALINCSPTAESVDLYQALLRKAGIRLEVGAAETTSTSVGSKLRTGFKAMIPFVGEGKAEGEASGELSSEASLTYEFIGYNLSDAQTVADLLQKAAFDRFVVLENFHYLPAETQRRLAYDLKTFHELRIRFIILGIWQEANLLHLYNSDLQDRTTEIPVEPWEEADFDRVIQKGAGLLNVKFAPDIVTRLKDNSYGNIGLLQEFLKGVCDTAGVTATCSEQRMIEDPACADIAIQKKLRDQRGQLLRVLQSLAGKSRTRTDSDGQPLVLPYYLVEALLTLPLDKLKDGVSRKELQDHIRNVHHRKDGETPRPSDMTHLLTRLPTLQQDMMSSPFLHYNPEEKRLRIVDMRQFFVLANADRESLLEEIPHPLRMDE